MEGVLCCWQPRAISEQPTETSVLRLKRRLQLKQTGVMQGPLKQTRPLFKKETGRHQAGAEGGINGRSMGSQE